MVLLTQALQYPTVEFYDYDEQTSVIPQPSGRRLDARDERLRQVALAEGLLWTSASLPPALACCESGTSWRVQAACCACCL